MTELNDLFDYGYKIYQNKEYFKFSIDSILLAEFVNFKKNDSILDLCTGNVPIPLILTSKDSSLQIDCVEVQAEIYDLAKKSIEYNNVKNINIINADAKKLKYSKKYDIITCNPPYFKVTRTSQLNENQIKKIARHEIMITLDDTIKIAFDNLKENGKFYLSNRIDRLLDAINIIEKRSFGIRKICLIFTKENSNAEFFLMEIVKNKKSDPKIIYKNIQNLDTYKNIFD